MAKFDVVRNQNTGKLEAFDHWISEEDKAAKLQAAIERNEKHYTCPVCGCRLSIKLSYGVPPKIDENGVILIKGYATSAHWYHRERKNPKYRACPLFTEGRSTKGGTGIESDNHLQMKQRIGFLLEKTNGINGFNFEKFIIKDGKRRKPDLDFWYNGNRYALECQVSYLPPSDLIQRTDFFRNNEIVPIWIFPEFKKEDPQSHMKLSHYDSGENTMVFDEECFVAGKNNNKFSMKVFYKEPIIHEGGIKAAWRDSIVSLDDLHVTEDYIPVFSDYSMLKQKIEFEMDIKKLSNELTLLANHKASLSHDVSIKRKENKVLSDEVKELSGQNNKLYDQKIGLITEYEKAKELYAGKIEALKKDVRSLQNEKGSKQRLIEELRNQEIELSGRVTMLENVLQYKKEKTDSDDLYPVPYEFLAKVLFVGKAVRTRMQLMKDIDWLKGDGLICGENILDVLEHKKLIKIISNNPSNVVYELDMIH